MRVIKTFWRSFIAYMAVRAWTAWAGCRRARPSAEGWQTARPALSSYRGRAPARSCRLSLVRRWTTMSKFSLFGGMTLVLAVSVCGWGKAPAPGGKDVAVKPEDSVLATGAWSEPVKGLSGRLVIGRGR